MAEEIEHLLNSSSESPLFSLPRQWPRGPLNELIEAAYDGSPERLVALLSDGSIDIDQGLEIGGYTPLMFASLMGRSHMVRILLDKGANVSVLADNGFTALHVSAQRGYHAVSKMLVEAPADLEAATNEGDTALHLASTKGHLGVMGVLIGAGANADSRKLKRFTPLYMAAQEGHKDAVKMLLRAKANPLLTNTDPETGITSVPLDVAARKGHLEVVRELVQQVGIEGCGGATGGLHALLLGAIHQHLDVMAVLTNAGVVDNGEALTTAVHFRSEASVKFLLQQKKDDKAAYATTRLRAIGFRPSPRIVRLLVDAGADTTTALRVTNQTPLASISRMLREKKIVGKDATEDQLHRLEGIRRLLLRVEAVHAVSFLWPVDAPSIIGTAAEDGASRKVATSTPFRMMLPILRRRARRPRVLLACLFRWVVMFMLNNI